MDVPFSSAAASRSVPEVLSDFNSDLSDPPTDLDEMDVSIDDGLEAMDLNSSSEAITSPAPLKRKSTAIAKSEDESMKDSTTKRTTPGGRTKRARLSHHRLAIGQTVPNEILQRIGFELDTDQLFANFTLVCKTFANALTSKNSIVWKTRFLSLYDHPFVNKLEEYSFAYRTRNMVLRKFIEFKDPRDKRLPLQLEALRHMVVETYYQPASHFPPPLTSFNLTAFADKESKWMVAFLSCPYFPKPRCRYGAPHPQFDALQLVLSHLLLSPASDMAYLVPTSRENYDVTIVYNWGKPFATLYRRLPVKAAPAPRPSRQTMFPNLRPRPAPKPEPEFELDTYALLHIRNFWHRHLIDYPLKEAGEDTPRRSNGTFENTYSKMARKLCEAGITPKQWDEFLQNGLPPHIAGVWYGHWSCAHPWPRKKDELAEMQSCAEDWTSVDPLKLEFCISTDNAVDGFWPPIFSDIPAFANTIPQSGSCAFIRGIAPFVDLRTITLAAAQGTQGQATLTIPKLPKYHPYLSLRLRGVIHPIASHPQPARGKKEDDGIPGWNRIVVVLYQPTKKYLIEVLEHAEEEYGGAFGPTLTSQLTQNGQLLAGGGGGAGNLDYDEMEEELEAHLEQKLLNNPTWRNPNKMDRITIEMMEEKYKLSEHLNWDDIEYAYAYEGVLLPGGKIMMGRWWRCGVLGDGDGMEVGADGEGLEEQPNSGSEDAMDVDEDDMGGKPTGGASGGHGNLERGPFLFWSG